MNKEMRALLAKIQAKTAEAKSYFDGENKDIDKATALMDEVDALTRKYETAKRIYESEKLVGAPTEEEVKAKTVETAISKFANAIRGFIKKGLVEGVDEDGGYTVPEDIQTTINKWAEVEYSLLTDIDIVPVTTNKGARTYQKKGQADIFMDLDENGAITKEIEAPKFERISYTIQDRAGFMPVSNDLIADSDANIAQVVGDWLGKANVATSNAKILEIIAEKALNEDGMVEFGDLDGIKYAVNVTLGQAYKSGAKIYTNDDGLNYLDTLVDLNGRPILNPDPTDSAKLQLRCGTVVVPIKVLPNAVLPTGEGMIPFIVGDLKSGVRKYDRQHLSIKASDVAVIGDFNAYAQNMTLFRAITRDDYRLLDGDAFVMGFIPVPAGE